MAFDDHNQLLLNIAQKRCQDSFKALFTEYSAKIFGFGKNGRLSDTQSRDLVQEVMTTIWQKADLFDPQKGQAATWIFTVARNTRFDIYRKNQREHNFISSENLWDIQIVDSDNDLETQLSDQSQQNLLREKVSQLPTDQKEVIEAIYFEGDTQEEFSEKKAIPLGTVKSRIRLAIHKLQKGMKGL